MYTTVLFIHSWIRWVALVAGFGATFAAVRNAERPADRWGMILVTMLDVQMLLGLLLYFVVSPNMREIMANFGDAMKNPATRFWAVEHVTAMLGAIIVAHVGRVLGRKAKTPGARRMRLLICFGLATLLMMAGMPWPNRPGGRPYFRF